MTPIVGFAPDADSTTAGVLTDCEQMIPALTGMEAAPTPQTADAVPALGAECKGAAVLTKMDGTRRMIAGTGAALYELSGGSWVDRSDTGGYTGSGDSRWCFAQFGNDTIATNGTEALQKSATGAFAAISGAPVAKIAFTVKDFVMTLNTSSNADEWYCCAAFDAADWATSIDTQCAKGRLVATNGAITAGARLGEYAIAYKARSMYIGQYVGAPAVWQWQQVSGGDAGCAGQSALCDIGGAHFFVGESGFYLFDGTRPVPVADGQVRQWFLDDSDPSYRYRTQCMYDGQHDRVWIFYPKKGSSTPDSALVWHVKSKMWGRANRGIEAVLNYISTGVTIDGLTSLSATIETLPNVAFDSQYWLSGGRALSIFDTSHQLQTLTGAAGASSMTSGDYGDDMAVTRLQRVRVRYAAGQGPTTATATTYAKMNSGEDFVQKSSGTLADGKFDVRQSGRWHRVKVAFTGDVKVVGAIADYVQAGSR